MSQGQEGAPAGADVPENLRVFAHAITESAGLTLATALDRAVNVDTPTVSRATADDVLASAPLPWVVAEIPYQRGLRGRHWMVLTMPTVHALRGADAAGGELDAAALAAVKETIDQLFGAAGPALMPLFAKSIAFGPATISLVKDRAQLPGPLANSTEAVWAVRAHASGAGGFDADLVLIVDHLLGEEIAAGAADEPTTPVNSGPSKIDLVLDVSLPIRVELGRARMQIQDILKLVPGSVIELDKSAGDPVDLYINDRPIARGEVVVIDENFGVRLTGIVTASERIKTLR